MVISHKYKFIFLHVPKTAGTSILEVLKPFCEVFRLELLSPEEAKKFGISEEHIGIPIRHLPATEIKKMVDPEIWNTYFKFAFVRNPFDWVVSNYFYVLNEKNFSPENKKFIKSKEDYSRYENFKSFAANYYRGKTVNTQTSRLFDKDGKLLVDFVGKLENINEDFRKVMDRLGIKDFYLPHINKTEHRNHREYYDEFAEEAVKKAFEKDFLNFGYSKDLNLSKKFELLISLYNENNPLRANEYKECLEKNLANPFIGNITVFYDVSKDDGDNNFLDFLISKKVNIVPIKERPTYEELFKYANKNLNGSKIIIANGDIYFNDSLSLISDSDLNGIFLSLTRWNQNGDGTLSQFKVIENYKVVTKCKICGDVRGLYEENEIKECRHNPPCWIKTGCKARVKDLEVLPGQKYDWSDYSQDAWIFRAPLKFNFRCNFQLGTFHCDSFLNHHLKKSGLRVYNPSNDIHACHLHLTGIRRYNTDDDYNFRTKQEKLGNFSAGIPITGVKEFLQKENIDCFLREKNSKFFNYVFDGCDKEKKISQKRKAICVSFPRSGHHIFADCLGQLYSGDLSVSTVKKPLVQAGDFFYCESHSHCNMIPCTDSRMVLQKTHDFFSNVQIDEDLFYFIQYRNPIESIISMYCRETSEDNKKILALKGKKINIDESKEGWKKYAKEKIDYWKKFVNKWVINHPKKSMVFSYEDFAENSAYYLSKAILFLRGFYPDEGFLEKVIEKNNISKRTKIKKFIYYEKNFFLELIKTAEEELKKTGQYDYCLSLLDKHHVSGEKIKVCHVINPVKIGPESDLFLAQPITFETMRRAKDNARKDINVELLTTQYLEDVETIPDFFKKVSNLNGSVLDLKEFQIKRRLPLLKDILEKAYKESDADYIIYTNADIALMPFFYNTVKFIIDQGYDAFVINKRIIPSNYSKIEEIPMMYAEFGMPHSGWDCFVFKKNLFTKFILGDVCVGIPNVDYAFIANLIAYAEKFKIFEDLHATFHIGDERVWGDNRYNDYYDHNWLETEKIYNDLSKKRFFHEKPIMNDLWLQCNGKKRIWERLAGHEARILGLNIKNNDETAYLLHNLLKEKRVDIKLSVGNSCKYNRKKIAFVDLSWREKTKSSDFFIEILKEKYDVEFFWDNRWADNKCRTNISAINSGDYYAVIFWQVIPLPEELKLLQVKKVIIVPMYDAVANFLYEDKRWLIYKDFKFISFSKILHDKISTLGLNSLYVKFYPKIDSRNVVRKHRVGISGFFWQRKNEINFSLVENLIGENHFSKFYFHDAIDPDCIGWGTKKISASTIKKYNIEITKWFKEKKDYLKLLDDVDVYFAPRLKEGIGLSFLEAMSMGKCIVAPDFPTMNEYIINGVTGILYDPDNPKQVDFKKISTIKKNAEKSCAEGYAKWLASKAHIFEFIEKESVFSQKEYDIQEVIDKIKFLKNKHLPSYYQK